MTLSPKRLILSSLPGGIVLALASYVGTVVYAFVSESSVRWPGLIEATVEDGPGISVSGSLEPLGFIGWALFYTAVCAAVVVVARSRSES